MDEQALDRLFSLAKGDGYTKSFEEFKVLMNSNEEAISNMFSLAKGDGYKKDVEEFKTLVGFNAAPVKKKILPRLFQKISHWFQSRKLVLRMLQE